MMKNLTEAKSIFYDFIRDFGSSNVDMKNYYNDYRYDKLWMLLYKDLEFYNKFIADGRRDDVFMSVLEYIKENDLFNISYGEFFERILLEIRKYDIDNCLILPLNGLEKKLLPEVMDFDYSDIKIFAVNEGCYKKKKGNTLIAKYYKERIGGNLNVQHMMFKEKYFFETPVLTAIIKGQNNNEVYHSAQEILQGLYSLIRIFDLLHGRERKGWNNFIWPNYPTSYAVYRRDYDSFVKRHGDYGHQMKIFSSPILDVDTKKFVEHSDEIIKTFKMLIDTYFEARGLMNEEIYYAKKRWVNSMQMFNTAYDLASIERYDSTIVTLLSLLESLFLDKNSRHKKDDLSNQVSEYVERDCYKIITESYQRRNKYLHDGLRVGGIAKYKLVENEHNYVPGYRPFTQYSFWGYPEEIKDIKVLMKICADVILKMIRTKNFIVGQYVKSNNQEKWNINYLDEIISSIKMSKIQLNDFNKYLSIRGIGVYYDTAKSIKAYTSFDTVDYFDFMGLIRYDKNIRDILYKMLGVYEEKMKNILYSNFNCMGSSELEFVGPKNISRIQKIRESNMYGWNLLRNSKLDIGSINYIFKHFNFSFKSKSDDFYMDIENVHELRKLVMHHNMLLIDQKSRVYSKTLIDVRLSKITTLIKSLYNLLDDEYGKGLITAINKARWDESERKWKSSHIFIDKLEGGYDEI